MATRVEPRRLSPGDPHSFSRPEEWCCLEIRLNLKVDFNRKVISGSADYLVERKEVGADVVIFDTRDIVIKKVYDKASGAELAYSVSEPYLTFGSKLEVTPPADCESALTVVVDYETSPEASALQWMSPEQTAGKTYPYLFSQCQAIHARSLLPCQDTPAVKAPYYATISVPGSLQALMSAKSVGSSRVQDGHTVREFHQPVPIPSYLIAIAVGDLVSKQIGPRTHVWTEAEMLDKSAYEFARTEDMLQKAEELCGPYIWSTYDLLVLPPSFPYGGMENPCLTFVTPTVLAGDRSLADVIAHEICHSWTGNLVTNVNAEHFWLNEGHTVFVERKVLGLLYGEQYRQFCHVVGWNDLEDVVNQFGTSSGLTCLVQSLTGIDPDDAFSRVPYEKGSCLLFYLESLLGGPEVFNGWLKAYIEKFKLRSITSEDWKDFLYEYFHDKRDTLNSVDWNAWLYLPGMPPVKPKFDMTMADQCKQLSDVWMSTSDGCLGDITSDSYDKFTPKQKIEFLSLLAAKTPLSLAKCERMNELYFSSSVQNADIKCKWLQIGLRSHFDDAINPALDFVNSQGRMKFTRPIYRDLYAWVASRDVAINNFVKHRHEMHNITASMVAKDLHLSP